MQMDKVSQPGSQAGQVYIAPLHPLPSAPTASLHIQVRPSTPLTDPLHFLLILNRSP